MPELQASNDRQADLMNEPEDMILLHEMMVADPKVQARLDTLARELIDKYQDELEGMTCSQLREVIGQAIESGDFQRAIHHDKTQIVYLPFSQARALRQDIEELKQRLKMFEGPCEKLADNTGKVWSVPGSPWDGACLCNNEDPFECAKVRHGKESDPVICTCSCHKI